MPFFGVTASAEDLTISTLEELEAFRNAVNNGNNYSGSTITLENDIDMSGKYGENTESGTVSWTPIGTSAKTFTGTFDGNGHTIKGLYINKSDQNYCGLFGYVTTATIKNLTVGGSVTGKEYVGGIVGNAPDKATFENCENNATIVGSRYVGGISGGAGKAVGARKKAVVKGCANTASVTANGSAGGIVGYGLTSLSDCYNTGDITVTSSVSNIDGAGGIMGQLLTSGSISGCFNRGIVTLTGSSTRFKDYLGGIVGYNQGTVTNSYNPENISTTDENVYIGGIVGYNNSSVSNCYSIAVVDGTAPGAITGCNVSSSTVTGCYYLENTAPDAVGTDSGSTDAKKLSLGEFNTESTFDGWDFENTWEISSAFERPLLRAVREDKVAVFGGSGTIEMPYLLPDTSMLEALYNAVNEGNTYEGKYFAVTEDIDMSQSYGGDIDGGEVSWTPIGSAENKFAGTVLGRNHTIKGLYINTPDEDYKGLFGYITGTVQDLTVAGSVTGRNYAGGVAGYVEGGRLENCQNNAVINAASYVGGIVGGTADNTVIAGCSNTTDIFAKGAAGGIAGSGDSLISDCFNVGNITAEGMADVQDSTGGITGVLSAGGAVERSFNKSTITVKGGKADLRDYLGGVAGLNEGDISDSYNAGFAEAKDNYIIAGGVAGSSSGSITNTYSAGNVSGGGVTGANTGSVTKSYYLENTAESGETSQELGESDFAQQTTFDGWNFDDVWQMSEIYGRPVFKKIPENEFAVFNGGGTKNNPYIISNLALLEAFRDNINSGKTYENQYFKITHDIDMADKYGDGKASWTAIGSYTNETSKYTFKGYLDGNGKKITGFYLSGAGYQQGLFGYNEGSVENLTIEGSVSGNTYIGAFVGYNRGSLKHCISNADVTGSGNYTGGIAGWNNGGSIEECYNTGNVSGAENIGGIAGVNSDSAVVKNSYNTGSVSGTRRIGGITGQNSGTVQTSYDTGVINNAATVTNTGGIAGQNSGTVTGCYYLSTSAAGGISNSDTQGSAQRLTEEEFKRQALFRQWDFITVWGFCDDLGRLVLRAIPEGEVKYFKGAGTEEVPYIISDIDTLEKLSDYVKTGSSHGEYFVLSEDIDMSTLFGADTEEGEVSWPPIGNSAHEFDAHFNGDGHTIKGLYINTTENDQGLFGVVGVNGTIRNIKVEGAVTGGNNVAIIAGENKGLIEVANSTGSVSGAENAGGITGYNNGGTVLESYSNTEVIADSYAGGLSGMNKGTLQNGYNIGLITGNNSGGVVGGNQGATVKCYNIGEVLGDENIGSVAGVNDGTLTNCHYIRNAGHSISAGIGQDNASGSAASISKIQFSNQLMFPEWDFYDVWRISDILARPVLRDISEDSIKVFDGAGTEDDPFIITDAETLEKFARYINAGYGIDEYFKIADDAELDLTGKYGPGLDTWIPIGSTTNPFNGHFDGNNKTITGLVIDASNGYQGLFGCVGNKGYVSDITVDGTINGKDDIGGIAGSNSGTLENCHNLSAVSGGSSIGGIAGYNSGTIINCDNTGSISGTSDVGGIFGYSSNTGSIANCVGTGTVKAQSNAGGIAGRSAGNIENCLAVCGVNAETGAGGIAGSNNGAVTDCDSAAKVTGEEDAGGIVGTNTGNGKITGCRYDKNVTDMESEGGVSALSHAGGIAGRNAGTVENCFNTYNVDGGTEGTEIGGIVGYNTANVRTSYSVGSVNGGSRTGGAIGYSISGNQVSRCYYNSDIYTEENSVTGTAGVSTERFENGAVTHLLQTGQTDAYVQVWGQDVNDDGREALPVLTDDEDKTVYKVTFATESLPEYDDRYANYGYTVDIPVPDDTYILAFRKWLTAQETEGEEFTAETPVVADITVYAVGEVKYGEKETDKVVSTTYGVEKTQNLSEYTEFDNGTTPSGEAFIYEVTGGTDPDLQINIDGDVLTVFDTSYAGVYTLEITAKQNIGPQMTLFSVDNDTKPFTFDVRIEIARAEGAAAVTMEDYVCSDDSVEPQPASETNGTDNVTYEYKAQDADDSAYSGIKPLIAGEYTVRATFAQNTNYNKVIVTDDFTVNHVFSEEWSDDGTEHWHECVCGARDSVEEHIWDDGVVTKNENCTEAGNKRFVCTVCGHIRNDEIPAWGHDLVYTIEDTVVRETCRNGCDHDETMKFVTQSGATKIAVEYSEGWLGGDVEVVYVSGDEELEEVTRTGSYTAKFSIGDFLASIPITVKSHKGGGGGSSGSAANTAAPTGTPEPASTAEPEPTASPEPSTSPKPSGTPEPKLHEAYIIGDETGSFRPDGFITRAEITAILAVLDGFDDGDYSSSFKDVYSYTWYNKYIGYEEDKNIITGYEDGTFHPEEPLNRAELAMIIVKYKGMKLSDDTSSAVFKDIDGHWAKRAIQACYERGYVTGYEDNTYKPDNYITRAEAVSMINRVLNRIPDHAAVADSLNTDYKAAFTDVPLTHWGYYDIAEASVTHEIHDFH